MIDDIVNRLRDEANRLRHVPRFVVVSPLLHEEAADEIISYSETVRALEEEVEYLRAENERLKNQRFDLQAADHIVESVRDVLIAARRLTDMYNLTEEAKEMRRD